MAGYFDPNRPIVSNALLTMQAPNLVDIASKIQGLGLDKMRSDREQFLLEMKQALNPHIVRSYELTNQANQLGNDINEQYAEKLAKLGFDAKQEEYNQKMFENKIKMATDLSNYMAVAGIRDEKARDSFLSSFGLKPDDIDFVKGIHQSTTAKIKGIEDAKNLLKQENTKGTGVSSEDRVANAIATIMNQKSNTTSSTVPKEEVPKENPITNPSPVEKIMEDANSYKADNDYSIYQDVSGISIAFPSGMSEEEKGEIIKAGGLDVSKGKYLNVKKGESFKRSSKGEFIYQNGMIVPASFNKVTSSPLKSAINAMLNNPNLNTEANELNSHLGAIVRNTAKEILSNAENEDVKYLNDLLFNKNSSNDKDLVEKKQRFAAAISFLSAGGFGSGLKFDSPDMSAFIRDFVDGPEKLHKGIQQNRYKSLGDTSKQRELVKSFLDLSDAIKKAMKGDKYNNLNTKQNWLELDPTNDKNRKSIPFFDRKTLQEISKKMGEIESDRYDEELANQAEVINNALSIYFGNKNFLQTNKEAGDIVKMLRGASPEDVGAFLIDNPYIDERILKTLYSAGGN